MTTTVTVNAHAGRPVEVTNIDTREDGTTSEFVEIVTPKSVRDFYITQTRQIRIREMPPA
jgi:hypothetical protein